MKSDWLTGALLVFVVILAVAANILWRKSIQRKASLLLDGKPSVNVDAYGSTYFPNDARRAEIAMALVTILTKHSWVDVQRLSPDDILSDYRAFDFDSLAAVSFVMDVEAWFHISIPDEMVAELPALRHYIEYIYAATSGAHPE